LISSEGRENLAPTGRASSSGVKFWQRNYYEHVIRNEEELERLRNYIVENPARWALDRLHPDQPPL